MLGVLPSTLARWRSAPVPAFLCFLAALRGTGAAWLLGMLTIAGGGL